MKSFKQIFFELENNTFYKPSNITKKFIENFPELGNEIILPINMEEEDKSRPFFIFNQNEDFEIQGNFDNVIVNIGSTYDNRLNDILKFTYDAFKEENVNFVGIACTFEEELDNKIINHFKNNHFINFDTIESDDIHFSMLRKVNILEKETRCLEGYSTINNNFIIHFEFNMKTVDFNVLDFEYIVQFLKEASDYMESKKACL